MFFSIIFNTIWGRRIGAALLALGLLSYGYRLITNHTYNQGRLMACGSSSAGRGAAKANMGAAAKASRRQPQDRRNQD
jgi:hypothetical protein